MRFMSLGVVALVCSATSFNAWALSPPWYQYNSQLKATVGADACAVVSDLTAPPEGSTTYTTTITACSVELAQALDSMVRKEVEFGRIKVAVQVVGPNGEPAPAAQPVPAEPEQIQHLLATTFANNPYFASAIPGARFTAVWLELKADVVQYWGDNLADRRGNINKVAAPAFGEVLDFHGLPSRSVSLSTAPRGR